MCEETPLIAASVLVTRCSQVNPTLPMETLLWCVWEGVCVCEWVRVCVGGRGISLYNSGEYGKVNSYTYHIVT